MKADRIRLLKEIEQKRGSFVISYITSTRQGAACQMAMDIPRIVFKHLNALSNREGKIDLFIHSDGGDGTVPWRLVTLLREYCKEFCVIVPHRAFSAATLTALGANKIIMHPMGMLGPTDPTVNGPYNPQNPRNPAELLGINVEDVTAYIALIKEDAQVAHEEEFVQALNKLTEKVHPLALGNVKRFLSQSRMMAEKLLKLHMDGQQQHKIEQIVDNLTSKLYFHGHPINRKEAREQIGLETVEDASSELEPIIWSLYEDYERDLNIQEPFNHVLEFVAKQPSLPPPAQPGGAQITPESVLKSAYVESTIRTDCARMSYEISGTSLPNGTINATFLLKKQGWVEE
jgi:hypothetical protein